jgi:hypothetical protein
VAIWHQPPSLFFSGFQLTTIVPSLLSFPCIAQLNLLSKSKSHCDWWSVSQSVLVSSPIWGLWPHISSCMTVIALSMRGALCDERTSLSFVKVTFCSNMYVCMYIVGEGLKRPQHRNHPWSIFCSNKSVISMYNIFTFYILLKVCVYSIYRASVSPGSLQQIMLYLQ